jgi:hypothetical protein
MRISAIISILLLLLIAVIGAKRINRPRKDGRRIVHERIQPAGGYIGFVKAKYAKK